MKKKVSKERNGEQPKSGPVCTSLIKLGFEILKYFLQDLDLPHSSKRKEALNESFEELKGVIARLENKTLEMKQEIEKLKNRLLWTNILFLVLLVTLITQLFIR